MAKGKGKARRAPQQDTAPQVQHQSEVLYGAGKTPSLYNGTPSVLSPQDPIGPAESTESGQNSPNAATQSTQQGMFSATQASLNPPGDTNPMTVYALRNRPYPFPVAAPVNPGRKP